MKTELPDEQAPSAVPVSLPWVEPGDELDESDLAVARSDLEALPPYDVAYVLARYHRWLGAWQAWARTLVAHPDPLTSYGDAGARAAIREELFFHRRDVENHRAYVCRECRAEVGEMHKLDCRAEGRAERRR